MTPDSALWSIERKLDQCLQKAVEQPFFESRISVKSWGLPEAIGLRTDSLMLEIKRHAYRTSITNNR